MGDVDGGDAKLALDATDLGAQLHPNLGVQRRQRLVEQQNLGVDRQGPRQRHPLLLSARELMGIALAEIRQMDDVEHLGDGALDVGRRLAGDLQPEADVVGDCHVGEQGIGLKHHAHVALIGRFLRDVLAVDDDSATRRPFKARDHAQGGRLAAAAGSQKRDKLAAGYRQVEIVHGYAGKCFGDVGESQEGHR